MALASPVCDLEEFLARLELAGDRLPLPPASSNSAPVDPAPATSADPAPTISADPASATLAPRQQLLLFNYNNSSCSVCNGYYGPNFGEPVCVTCHAFLFPDFASYLPTSYFYSEKTDDRDSGNDDEDELSELNYSAERRFNRCSRHNLPMLLWQENSLDNEISPDEDVNQGPVMPPEGPVPPVLSGMAAPPQPPSVQRSLHILSTPRPLDNVAPGLVEQLPPEVLLGIFSYLDDLSLSACVCVCTRWRRLLRAQLPSSRWAVFTMRRWPLFRPMRATDDWYKTYQSLVNSCFCRNCLVQMCVQSQPVGEENSWRKNRLRAELKFMRNDPPEGIAAIPLDVKCCHWQASITGPIGSPYEGGIFYLYIQVPYGYPMSPPVVRFLTKILHPNVSRHGDVGIDSVHHNWSLALTLSKVLISIQSLLTDPYTAVCMEPQLGDLYMQDRPAFEALARQWTWHYAMIDVMPHTGGEYD